MPRIEYEIGLDSAGIKNERDKFKSALEDLMPDFDNNKLVENFIAAMEQNVQIFKDMKAMQESMVKMAGEDLKIAETKLRVLKEQNAVSGAAGNGSPARAGTGMTSPSGGSGSRATAGASGPPTLSSVGSSVGGGLLAAAKALLPVAHAVQSSVYSGWHDTDVVKNIGSVLGEIPLVGGVLQSATGLITTPMEKADQEHARRLKVFREGGEAARKTYINAFSEDPAMRRKMINMGITPDEGADSMIALSKVVGGVDHSQFDPLMGMKKRYGLEQESLGLMGAMVHGGASKKDQTESMGAAIGVALATNLERGRWGESVTAMKEAAARISTGDVKLQSLIERQTLIGSLGDRFKGNTASAQAMGNFLDTMGSGEGDGMMGMIGMRAAGLGKDSWFTVQMRLARGLGKEGGVQYEPLQREVDKYFGGGDHATARKKWARMTEAERDLWARRIAGRNKQMLPQVKDFLVGRYGKGGGSRSVDSAGITENLADLDTQAMPNSDMTQSRNYAEGGQVTEIESDLFGTDDPLQGAGRNFPSGSPGTAPSTQYTPSASTQGDSVRTSGVLSIDEFSKKYRTGGRDTFNKIRDSGPDGKGNYVTKPTDHKARDIYTTPGGTVYAPVDGLIRRVKRQSPNEVDGIFIDMVGLKDGKLYRFLHLEQVFVREGARVARGTPLGTIRKERMRRTAPHLHVEMYANPAAYQAHRRGDHSGVIDPVFDEQRGLGEHGLNTLVNGNQQAQPASAPAAVGSPSASEGSATSGATSSVKFDISVQDHRVNVTQRAAGRRMSGTGQVFGNRKA